MKLQVLVIFIFISLSSCNEQVGNKEEVDNDLNLSCEIIELDNRLNSLKELNTIYRATRTEKPILDSLYFIETTIQTELDSILISSDIDIEQAIIICRNNFGLQISKLDKKQRNFLQVLYGYEICGPKMIACGFPNDSTADQFKKRNNAIINAKNKINLYIKNKLNAELHKVFPIVKDPYKKAFYIVSGQFTSSEKFESSFRDSGCIISRNDSLYNKLCSDKDYAGFGEIK